MYFNVLVKQGVFNVCSVSMVKDFIVLQNLFYIFFGHNREEYFYTYLFYEMYVIFNISNKLRQIIYV